MATNISDTFTGNGTKVTYDFTFQYLNTTDIKIKLTAAGVDKDITAFTLAMPLLGKRMMVHQKMV